MKNKKPENLKLNILTLPNVGKCDVCGGIDELKSITATPKGFIFKFLGRVHIDICQKCISRMFRGCYKSL